MLSRLRAHVAALLTLDRRSLAALRMGLGALLLFDLGFRARFLATFYTNDGIIQMPPTAACPHSWGGSTTYEGAMFTLAAISAACLLVGYRTRIANIACYVLTTSMSQRAPHLGDGGDSLLVLLLLWTSFLPLGETWSLDARRRFGNFAGRSGSVLSIAGAALLLQPAIMYFSTALQKRGPEWRVGSAVWYAFQHDYWARPLAEVIREYPSLCVFATRSGHLVELLAPVLLFLPVATRWPRRVAIASLVGLQIGLALTIQLWLFPVHSTLALVPFISKELWDALERKTPPWLHPEKSAPTSTSRLLNILAAPFAFYVAIYSVAHLGKLSKKFPATIQRVAYALSLDEGWTMYSPGPLRTESTMKITVIDERGIETPEDQLRPGWRATLGAMREDYRAKYYIEGMMMVETKHPAFVSWVCRIGAPDIPSPKKVRLDVDMWWVGHREHREKHVYSYPCPTTPNAGP